MEQANSKKQVLLNTSLIAAARIAFLVILLVFPQIANAQLFETRAKEAFLMDAETGTVLFAKNPDEPFPPASLAKLMTVEVVFDAIKSGRLNLDDEFYISENAWRTGGAVSGGSTMFAKVKSNIRLEDLLKGAIIQSANDACIAIAEGMAGSEANFARLMTERARKLGLKTSTFVNSTGLPAEGEKVTARELAQLAYHIWKTYPDLYHYFADEEFTWNGIRQRNRNPLLRMDIGADGLKTGHTEQSGYALVGSVKGDDRRLFLVLAGMESAREREEEARKLADWGMRAFEKIQLYAKDEIIGEAQTYGGAKGSVALKANGPISIFVPITNRDQLKARVIYNGPVIAPVEEGQQIGVLKVWIGDTPSQETPVYAAESVPVGALYQRALDAVEELLIGWLRAPKV